MREGNRTILKTQLPLSRTVYKIHKALLRKIMSRNRKGLAILMRTKMRPLSPSSTFATLSPIPGYMQWLLSKLASSERSGSTFGENLLEAKEERALVDASAEFTAGSIGMEVMWDLLTSANHEWTRSDNVVSILEPILLRLCAQYLLREKKRGKALDSVANFHLQNGAMIGQLNWMADRSEKGLTQSGGIMVNYIYR